MNRKLDVGTYTPTPAFKSIPEHVAVKFADDDYLVALVGPALDDPKNLEQTLETARLFAAAPELLAACQYVVKYHREHDSGDGELFGLDFVTTCIAAIAKAGKP